MPSFRLRSLMPAICLGVLANPVLAAPPGPSLRQRLESLLEQREKGQLSREAFLAQAVRLLPVDQSSPDLQPVTLDHVTFRVPDMERSSRFYQDVLGMPLLRTDPVHYLGVGNSFMAIEPFVDPGSKTAFVDHFCLGLMNFDATRIVARLAEKGISIEGPADPDTVRFFDPDGIQVQLCSTDYARKQTSKADARRLPAGARLPPGPQVLTFHSDADDTDQPYALYLPRRYDPAIKYPLVMMLHGGGSNHRLALRRVFGKSNTGDETDVEASRYFPDFKDVEYVVAAPFARASSGYRGIAEKDVLDVLADVKRRFSIDEDRTYLTGLSMGGGGTLWIGLTRPDLWAALAPVCPGAPDGTLELISNGANLPMHFFHGDADTVVPPSLSREFVKRLEAAGGTAEYTEYPGVKHDAWVRAYENGRIFDWFAGFCRNRFPERVTYTSSHYQYDRAYWVKLDALTPGTPASVDARFLGPNQLTIRTKALDAFTLNLEGHPRFLASAPVRVDLDGTRLEVTGRSSMSFTRRKGLWALGHSQPGAHQKRPGSEGPLLAALSSRHVYVYGTQGNPGPEELAARETVATEAANWSMYRGSFSNRIMFLPRVVADRDLRPSDLQGANLVLFGTASTNSVIARYADRLPVQLQDPSGRYGMFYVFPAEGHYVAISSGLPFWQGNAKPGRASYPDQHKPLWESKDFIMFEDDVNNAIAEGYFDRDWRLPREASSMLKAHSVFHVLPVPSP